ncbi:Establishment of cohesion 1 [Bonamia ostreae]
MSTSSDTNKNLKIYVCLKSDRIVGFSSIKKLNFAYELEENMINYKKKKSVLIGIDKIWVCETQRRLKIAFTLLQLAR